MNYTPQEVIQFIEEEDVKFIRLAFCDVTGKSKNISIMPHQLDRAFSFGISIDASSILGFHTNVHSDLFLHPIPSTISVLPWRPEHGSVVRMFCDITYLDGTPFEHDSRMILHKAIEDAENMGLQFCFGSEQEFYLLYADEGGNPTKIPFDNATYGDVAPLDQCENVRRDICLTLERMEILPESSHHEMGPGQNEVDFHYNEPMRAADDALTFRTVVQTIAQRNGLYADFSPKPLREEAGNGFHVNISVKDHAELHPYVMAGILAHMREITIIANPVKDSYQRLGKLKAPKYISWGNANRSALIRVPAAKDQYTRMELRSPDPQANPYLLFALLIWAGLDGIANKLVLPAESDIDLFESHHEDLETLPLNINQAQEIAKNSSWISSHLPKTLIDWICK